MPETGNTGNRNLCLVSLPLFLLEGEGGVLPTVLVHGDTLLIILATVLSTGSVLAVQYCEGSHVEVGCVGGVGDEDGADGG